MRLTRTTISAMKSLFAVVYLAASMGLTAVLFADDRSLYPNQPLFVASWLALYGATVVLMLGNLGRIKRSWILPAALSCLALVSSIWSADPGSAMKYGVSLVFNVMFCSWWTSRYTVPEMLRLALFAILGMVGVSLLLWFASADIVRYIDPHARPNIIGGEPVRGLFNHKITAGLYSCIGILLVLIIRSVPARFTAGATLLFFLLLTGSASAVVLLVISCGLIAAVRLGRRIRLSPNGFMVSLLAVVAFATFGALLLKDPVLEMLGRDATLTGRTLLWGWGLSAIWSSPILGWGYQSYFESNDAYMHLISFIEFSNYDVPHFHNAYIQTAVDLGVPAMLAYVGMMFSAMRAGYSRSLDSREIEFELSVALIAVLLMAALYMNVFLVYNNFATVLVVATFMQSRSWPKVPARAVGRLRFVEDGARNG